MKPFRPSVCAASWRHILLPLVIALLMACSPYRPLPATSSTQPSMGWWAKLPGPRVVTVSDGVVMEMPDGLYRARFADQDGVFYEAANALYYRTQHGVVTALQGGIYVRYDAPETGNPWHMAHIAAPVSRLPQQLPVRLHHPD